MMQKSRSWTEYLMLTDSMLVFYWYFNLANKADLIGSRQALIRFNTIFFCHPVRLLHHRTAFQHARFVPHESDFRPGVLHERHQRDGVEAAAVRTVLFPRADPGAAQVRTDWLEHSVRVQRDRPAHLRPPTRHLPQPVRRGIQIDKLLDCCSFCCYCYIFFRAI